MSDDTLMSPEVTSVQAPEGTEERISISDAARMLSGARKNKQATSAEEAPAAEPIEESAPEADAAPQETEATGEIAQDDPEETPTLELPRSWSKEHRDVWERLDPGAQQYLLEQDSKTSTAVRKAQNEAAEQRKAAEAELQAVQQQRQQYEQALQAIAQNWQTQTAGQFADIQNISDEQRLATEDPLRYTQFLAAQRQQEAYQREVQALQQRAQQEEAQKWTTFATQEDQLFAQRVPDAVDPVKGQALKTEALKHLKEMFTEEEIGNAWSQPNSISLRDHRLQTIIAEWSQMKTAKAKVKATPPKAIPQVVRPGVASGKNSEKEARQNALEDRLNKTGSWKDAAALLMERRSRKP